MGHVLLDCVHEGLGLGVPETVPGIRELHHGLIALALVLACGDVSLDLTAEYRALDAGRLPGHLVRPLLEGHELV